MLDVVEPEMEEPEVAFAPEPAPAPAPTPAPVRTAIALAPPKSVTVEVPAGVLVAVRLIDSEQHQPGEGFAASLAAPLNVDDDVLAPQGANETVQLVDVRTSGGMKRRLELIVELVALTIQGREYSVQTESYVYRGASHGRSTAKKICGGAALGSIIGASAGTAAQTATRGK